jgi:hypothetical protein
MRHGTRENNKQTLILQIFLATETTAKTNKHIKTKTKINKLAGEQRQQHGLHGFGIPVVLVTSLSFVYSSHISKPGGLIDFKSKIRLFSGHLVRYISQYLSVWLFMDILWCNG